MASGFGKRLLPVEPEDSDAVDAEGSDAVDADGSEAVESLCGRVSWGSRGWSVFRESALVERLLTVGGGFLGGCLDSVGFLSSP